MTTSNPEAPAFVRLFYALALPEAAARKLLITANGLRRAPPLRHCRVRWVPEENLHVTLKFLGPQLSASVPELGVVLDTITKTTPPLETHVTRLTAFPTPRKAQIIVAELADPELRLTALATALEGTLAPFKIEPERRPFVAHVTLARLKEHRDLTTALERAPIAVSPFTIASACLFESELDPAGARYKLLHRSPLSSG